MLVWSAALKPQILKIYPPRTSGRSYTLRGQEPQGCGDSRACLRLPHGRVPAAQTLRNDEVVVDEVE